jgi:hypothetical protein
MSNLNREHQICFNAQINKHEILIIITAMTIISLLFLLQGEHDFQKFKGLPLSADFTDNSALFAGLFAEKFKLLSLSESLSTAEIIFSKLA